MKKLLVTSALTVLALCPVVKAQSDIDGPPAVPPPGAKVEFLDIKNNQRIARGAIIHFGLTKMGIAPAGVDKPSTGHHHLLIDEGARKLPPEGEPIPSDAQHLHFGNGQTDYQVDLDPGPHELRLLLGDSKHISYDPPVVSSVVHIVVVGKGQAAPPDDDPNARVLRDCDECDEIVVLQGGAFRMGTKNSKSEVQHRVNIQPFAIAVQPVTFKQWSICVEDGGCEFAPEDHGWGQEDRPVIGLSWNDAQQYVRWISEKAGREYRLPSEAEWEYAARAGTTSPYWWGWDIDGEHANCKGCGEDMQMQTVSVAAFPPNPWGLYDLSGNSAEWVQDCWHQSYQGAPQDGSAWMRGGDCNYHVLRGGYFGSSADDVRTASRSRYDTDVRYYANGFRVARDAD